jgi:hypothetical protein
MTEGAPVATRASSPSISSSHSKVRVTVDRIPSTTK